MRNDVKEMRLEKTEDWKPPTTMSTMEKGTNKNHEKEEINNITHLIFHILLFNCIMLIYCNHVGTFAADSFRLVLECFCDLVKERLNMTQNQFITEYLCLFLPD